MSMTTLTQIENKIYELSLNEQLLLMEKLAQTIRSGAIVNNISADQLKAMADDPEIQREIRMIEQEFALADFDGLEGV